MFLLMLRTTLFVDHTRLGVLPSLRTGLGARNPIDLGGRITAGAAISDALVPGGFVIAAHFGTIEDQSWPTEDFKRRTDSLGVHKVVGVGLVVRSVSVSECGIMAYCG